MVSTPTLGLGAPPGKSWIRHCFCKNNVFSNNIEVYEKPVPRTKKIPQCAVKLVAAEEKIIFALHIRNIAMIQRCGWSLAAKGRWNLLRIFDLAEKLSKNRQYIYQASFDSACYLPMYVLCYVQMFMAS